MIDQHQQQVDRLYETHVNVALQIGRFNELLSKLRMRRRKHYCDERTERNQRMDSVLTQAIDCLRNLRTEVSVIWKEISGLASTEPEIVEGLKVLNSRFEDDWETTLPKFQDIHDAVDSMLVDGVL